MAKTAITTQEFTCEICGYKYSLKGWHTIEGFTPAKYEPVDCAVCTTSWKSPELLKVERLINEYPNDIYVNELTKEELDQIREWSTTDIMQKRYRLISVGDEGIGEFEIQE